MMTDRCPRCGSTDPAVRGEVIESAYMDGPHLCDCPDDWHDRPTDDARTEQRERLLAKAKEHPVRRPRPTDDLPARLEAEEGHHDGGDITIGDLRAAAARIRELEDKVARLEARGITDMQHRIAELEAAVARLTALGNALADAAREQNDIDAEDGSTWVDAALDAWENR